MNELSADARALFERLATSLPPSEIAALRQAVRDHVEDFRDAARSHHLLPLDLAEALAHELDALLRDHAALPDAHLAVGAARYFVSHDDVRPDTSGVLGLDDDVAVFNHAVRQMGRADLVIDP